MAVLNERGLEIDNLPTLLAKTRQALEDNLLPILPVGETIDLDDSSILMRILAPLVETLALQEEALQGLHSQLYIETASGSKCDDLVALGGVVRLSATPSDALLMLYGVLNTTIPKESLVSSAITNDVFKTTADVVLNTSNINGSDFSFDNLITNHVVSISWTVDGNLNTNVPISVNILNTDTAPQAALKVANAVSSTTTSLTARVIGDYVSIVFTNQNSTGSFAVTNLTPVNIYKPVDGECLTLGNQPQDRNTIKTIQSPILGWLSVTNPFDANTGSNTEGDEALRKRYQTSKLSDGNSTYDHMVAALSNVRGVKYVDVYNNRLNNTVNGVPPHTFAPIVLGGAEADIAQAIVTNHPLGIPSFGDVTSVGYDVNSNPVTVSFSRPDLVPIKINIVLSIDYSFPDNGAALIRQSIIDYISTLTVGDDILYSRLFTPINAVQGFSVVEMSVGKVGGSLSNNNIVMQYNELPTISYEDITFGGV